MRRATIMAMHSATSRAGCRPPCDSTPLGGSCLADEGQKAVVIHAGQLFDGKSDRLLSNQVIVIQGDRIADVGPAGSVSIPAGAEGDRSRTGHDHAGPD
jgi:hypothetical protein